MKYLLYSLLLALLFYLFFAYLRGKAQTPKTSLSKQKSESCFSPQNFEIAYKYLHWKKHTTKRLSPQQRVILGSTEVEALENGDGKKIYFWKNNSLYLQVLPDQGVVPVFKQQSRAYQRKCQQLFCDLVAQAKFKDLPQHYHYRYSDGSGNQWQIMPNQLVYQPITPANSSSGIYSGGEAFSQEISLEQFEALEQLFLEAWRAKEQQSQERQMGTGSLRQSVLNSPIKSCLLKSNSALKTQIEEALNAFKTN